MGTPERPRYIVYNVADESSPVRGTDDDEPGPRPRGGPGAALCLSGGGFRATLFHAGAVLRLNELGLLRTLSRVSSVSGGSITAGMLGLAWKRLDFGPDGVARNLVAEVIEPLRRLARTTIDIWAIAVGALVPTITAAGRIEAAFRTVLFGDASLADLPDDAHGPRFVINAANVQSGALFRFSRPYIADARVGLNRATGSVPLARAVAASAAFPPVLSPMVIDFDPKDFEPGPGSDLHQEPYTSRVVLSDGGIYDNLGLETVFNSHETILVSDAGVALQAQGAPAEGWARHGFRAAELLLSQTVELRKRQLLAAYEQKRRMGAYWGIRSSLASYAKNAPGLAPLGFPSDLVMALAGTPTRLAALEGPHQEALIDWGYTVCDAAIRAHVLPDAPRPARTPFRTIDEGHPS